ncbi:MAG: DUF167 domain-containing protein [Candidatus Omnitrophica bacterium]|nr:DUF167 domain-containing protein [Candidatus Omnitrophota bacterium]MBU1128802.1 DUF167 domain-containing protein [Candidatus Omnitrophota bacterium]MBU1785138.1 DUF167 domain-containing protein [Candidatus Omnitrophota bacterium]MBU1851205.1 DUF167 domain-containing protein [Candidatus Omnitrophota bacterium]
MKVQIKVIPKSSRSELVSKDGEFRAYVRAAPDKGKANRELVELVAKEYGVPKSHVSIVSGETRRNKTVEVLGK